MPYGWNLIGSDANFSLADVNFTNSTGSQFTWANALTNNKVQAYLSYYDNSPATASNRKYKYVSTVSGMDDTSLRKNKGYWIYMNQSGNLTLPSAGGSLSSETFTWNKLRFWNGSEELNVSDAGDEGWIFETGYDYIYYWDEDNELFKEICDNPYVCPGSSTLSPWEGYFIYSNYDNITLIRQN